VISETRTEANTYQRIQDENPNLNPSQISRRRWRAVTRRPTSLRLHPALNEIGLLEALIGAVKKYAFLPDLILIATDGTILSGFQVWWDAVCDGQQEITCIELSISKAEFLPCMISYHRPRPGWNDFVLTCLALKLKPYYEARARENKSAGGKCKLPAHLPEAQHIEVREELGRVAGVGARTVSNVERILELAAPAIKQALCDGVLSVNRALPLCQLPWAEQLAQFTHDSLERANNKVIQKRIARLQKDQPTPDAASMLQTLQQLEAQHPGSVHFRQGRQQKTVVLIGQDLKDQYCQMGLKLA
jgi:hypothetical protein